MDSSYIACITRNSNFYRIIGKSVFKTAFIDKLLASKLDLPLSDKLLCLHLCFGKYSQFYFRLKK